MDLNHFLVWTVSFCCILSLIRLFIYSPKNNLGWIVICILILLIALVLLYFIPDIAGSIATFIWIVFVLVPMLGQGKINELLYQQRYKKARQLSSYLRWLHPTDGYFKQTELLLALELGQKGKIDKAIKIAERHKNYSISLSHNVQALLYYFKADWPGYLLWLKENIPEKVLFQEPTLLILYLRSLGETGDLNSLFWELEKARKILEKNGDKILNLARMFALAFSGKTDLVLDLFNTVLSIYPEQIRTFWLATSEISSGKVKVAREQLLTLRLKKDISLSNAIDWRLCHQRDNSEAILEEYIKQNIALMAQEINQEIKYKKSFYFKDKKAYITYILIAINFIYFGIENITGSSESIKTIYQLGGLVPDDVWAGEWWRLINANFLHFGWLHLLNNMFALYFLGRLVEYNLGGIRYFLAYSISGVGAMFVYSTIAPPNTILVGASAAVMGLVGVIFALMLGIWRRDKSRIASHNLRLLLLLITLQFIFDFATPQVSWLVHVLGLIIGFVCGVFLVPKT
jgi:rhomboid protease GluP